VPGAGMFRALTVSLALELEVLTEICPMATTGRALFKVRSSLDGLVYALKVFDLTKNDQGLIRREMVALNRQLSMPEKFPRYRCFFERDGLGYLLLDWMEGTPLSEAVRSGVAKGADEVRLRVSYLKELCATLSLVHKSGCCHRDIKPQNILLRNPKSPREGVVLIDFGLAAMKRSAVEGTHGFAAPEQQTQTGVLIDRRTDIFGVGAVAWWLLSGVEFSFFSDDDGGWSGLAAGVLRSYAPDVSERLERTIIKALSFRPADRHGSAQELGVRFAEACS